MSSNHLPVILTLDIGSALKVSRQPLITNWNRYRALCNRLHLNPHLKSPQNIDAQIYQLQQDIHQAHRKATYSISTRRCNAVSTTTSVSSSERETGTDANIRKQVT